MIVLISRWKLKNGCPADLVTTLESLADKVKAAEPDTLLYSVNLQARSPLNQPSQLPAPIPGSQQTEVDFFEIYKDAQAFAHHINGPVFTQFREQNIQHFYEDPEKPGWPNTETVFLDKQSMFVRSVLADC